MPFTPFTRVCAGLSLQVGHRMALSMGRRHAFLSLAYRVWQGKKGKGKDRGIGLDNSQTGSHGN